MRNTPLQIEKAKIDAQRKRAEAEAGPVRYLAEVVGIPATDLERPVRLVTLARVAVLDPMVVALLLAAGVRARRAGSPMVLTRCRWHAANKSIKISVKATNTMYR
jgi:hypothetical protein